MAGSWDFGGGSSSASGSSSWSDLSAPPPPPTQTSGSGFGGEPTARAPGGQTTTAPVVWLLAGLVFALASIGVAVVTNSLWLNVAAWFFGGPVAIALLAVFAQADTARRANPWYAEAPLADWARRALVLLSLVAVAYNAWKIADFFARGGF